MNKCRYCFEYIRPKKRLYPCNCTSPVHYNCLLTWNKTRTSDTTKCEICKCYYYNAGWKYIFIKPTFYNAIQSLIIMILYYLVLSYYFK